MTANPGSFSITSNRSESSRYDSRHVLIVCPDFPPATLGGVGLVCRNLAEEYSTLGWASHVLALDPTDAGLFLTTRAIQGGAYSGTLLPVAVKVVVRGISSQSIPPPSIPSILRILRELAVQRMTVVHLHGHPVALVDLVGFFCLITDTPFIVTFHGIPKDVKRMGTAGYSVYRLWRWFSRLLYRKALCITAVSQSTLDDVRRAGFEATKMTVVPITTSHRGRLTLPQENDHSLLLDRPDLLTHQFVLCIGALDPRKGQDILIRAFAKLTSALRESVSLDLVLAGYDLGTDYSFKLRSLSQELGVSDRVHFLGAVDNERKDLLLQRARWIVVPSRSEAAPSVVLEALSFGGIVVASDIPAIREITRGAECIRFFQSDNPADLSRALIDLADHPSDEQRLREEARNWALGLPTWRDIAAAYLRVFQSRFGPGEETSANLTEL